MIMAFEIIWYVRFVEILSLVIAFVLVVLAYGGYRKSGSRAMLAAALGFAMIGVARLTEGILFELLGFPLVDSHAYSGTIMALGFIVLLYSVQKIT